MNAADLKPTKSIRAVEALGPGVHQIAPRLYLRCIQRKAGLSRSVMLRWQDYRQPRNKSLGPWRSDLYGHFLAEAQRAGLAILEKRDVAMAIDESGALGTFQEAAEAYMAKNLSAFRSDKHRKRWRRLMETTYSTLGHLKIPQIEVGHVANALEPDWLRTPVQVMRVRGQIEQGGWSSRARSISQRQREQPQKGQRHGAAHAHESCRPDPPPELLNRIHFCEANDCKKAGKGRTSVPVQQ